MRSRKYAVLLGIVVLVILQGTNVKLANTLTNTPTPITPTATWTPAPTMTPKVMRAEQLKAQAEPMTLYEYDAANIKWSDDGSVVTFADQHLPIVLSSEFSEFENWYRYDTRTSTLTASRSWPFRTELTAEEWKWLQLDDWDIEPYVLASPNKRFLLYPGAVTVGQDSFYIDLMLADRQTHEAMPTGSYIYDIQSGTDAFDVVWNESGNSLITRPKADWEATTGVYMSGFKDGLSQLVRRTDLDEIVVQGKEFHSSVFYDVSDNDRYILLDAILDQPEPSDLDRYMIVFDVNDATKSVVLPNIDARKVPGAMFKPHDDSKVVLINETGLVEMDWATGQSVVLDASITSSDIYRKRAYFSPDGKWLAYVGSPQGTVLWNIEHLIDAPTPTSKPPTPTLTATCCIEPEVTEAYQPPQEGVFDLAWSPDDALIVAATDVGIAIFDQQLKLKTMLREHSGRVFAVAWKPDGQQFVSAGEDGQLILWQRNGRDFAMLMKQQGTTAWTDKRKVAWQTAVAWSPDGTRIASLGADQTSTGFVATLHIWDAQTLTFLRIVQQRLFFTADWGDLGGLPRTLAWSANSSQVAVAGRGLSALPAADYEDLDPFGGMKAQVLIYDAGTGSLAMAFRTPEEMISLAWSPATNGIAVGTMHGGYLICLEENDSCQSSAFDAAFTANDLAWNPDGTKLVSADELGNVSRSEIINHKVFQFPGLQFNADSYMGASLLSVAWSHNGKWIVAGNITDRLVLWETVSVTPIVRAELP